MQMQGGAAKLRRILRLLTHALCRPFSACSIDTLEKMKADVKRVEGLLEQKSSFKEFYRWLFDFVKEEPERKTIGQRTHQTGRTHEAK